MRIAVLTALICGAFYGIDAIPHATQPTTITLIGPTVTVSREAPAFRDKCMAPSKGEETRFSRPTRTTQLSFEPPHIKAMSYLLQSSAHFSVHPLPGTNVCRKTSPVFTPMGTKQLSDDHLRAINLYTLTTSCMYNAFHCGYMDSYPINSYCKAHSSWKIKLACVRDKHPLDSYK